MLVGQQGTAVAVVSATEVLAEVAATAVVVTVAAVVAAAAAAAAAAAVATAAKAEELSVKFVEPFDSKMNKQNHKSSMERH